MQWLLYILTNVWVLVKIVIFSIFWAKKLKKSNKFARKFSKKHVFLSLHQNAGRLFYSQKIYLFSLKTPVDQCFGANLKNMFFCRILLQISCFLKLFPVKNIKIAYFDQRLECAAPKRWSKYTTNGYNKSEKTIMNPFPFKVGCWSCACTQRQLIRTKIS